MEAVWSIIGDVNSLVWGWPTLVLLAGTGIFLTIGLRGIQLTKIRYAFKVLLQGRKPGDTPSDNPGDITPFNSLMTAMSGTVGAGNIAGVAAAITIGGAGSLFYMWLIGLIGMATKYSECMLGSLYREQANDGSFAGGPMFYMKNGVGGKLGKVLANFFALSLLLAGFGIGNMFQTKTISGVLEQTWFISSSVTGFFLSIMVTIVIIGGIKRIGEVAGKIVPTMIVLYMTIGILVILANIGELGNAFVTIFSSAFGLDAAAGGAVGGGIMLAMRQGFARGVFSNESGMGSAAIAHASAQTSNPVKQGHIAMLGTFIDTILVCTITGLAIVMSGVLTNGLAEGLEGAQITAVAFATGLHSSLSHIVALCLVLFVFTTILAWYYYCERCLIYFNKCHTVIRVYQIIWVLIIFISSTPFIDFSNIILISDTLNAMMIYPNLIALLILSPEIFNKTKEFWKKG